MIRMGTQKAEVTALLHRWSAGEPEALDRLVPIIYGELRRMAESFLRFEGGGHPLQPTALVHELYLKLVDQERAQWRDREQFFGVAAKMMRRILVDHARKAMAGKRGARAEHVTIDDALEQPAPDRTLLAVDEALTRFAGLDPERARIVELRYFGGLELQEIAELLQVSRTTVKRHWTVARMWLHRELEDQLGGPRPVG